MTYLDLINPYSQDEVTRQLRETYPALEFRDRELRDPNNVATDFNPRTMAPPVEPAQRQEHPDEVAHPSMTFFPHPNNGFKVKRTQLKDDLQNMPWEPETVIDKYTKKGVCVAEKVIESGEKIVRKRYEKVEKTLQVENVTVKERKVFENKVEMQYRDVTVPKIVVQEKVVEVEIKKQHEKIVEVPRIVEKENIIKIPKVEVQERIIQVPKVVFEEKIEYEDHIEYREVPINTYVDEVHTVYEEVQVPQNRMVPMYEYVEQIKYVEVSKTEIQEQEKVLEVPIYEWKPVPNYIYIDKPMYKVIWEDQTETIHDNTCLPIDPPTGLQYPELAEPSLPEGPRYDHLPPTLTPEMIPGFDAYQQNKDAALAAEQARQRNPEAAMVGRGPRLTQEQMQAIATQQGWGNLPYSQPPETDEDDRRRKSKEAAQLREVMEQRQVQLQFAQQQLYQQQLTQAQQPRN